MPRHSVVRAAGVDRHTSGALESWGGIVSAHLDDWAAELGCTPEDVLQAIEQQGIEPLLDTAEQKGQGEDRDRPTDPTLRCLALTTGDAQTLTTILDG